MGTIPRRRARSLRTLHASALRHSGHDYFTGVLYLGWGSV